MRPPHFGIIVLFSIFALLSNEGFAQVKPTYVGDKASFEEYVRRYNKVDWPVPVSISYFDPSGKNRPVIRYARWTPTVNRINGIVVHFNGRTEFIERNIYTYKDLLDRGFEVWAFDWRGQGLSERQTSALQKQSIDSFGTYLTDATYFIENVVKIRQLKGRKIILAHSMGGQIALRYLLSDEGRNVFDFAVLSSPLLRLRDDKWHIRLGNKIKTSVGLGGQCVLGYSDKWESDFNVPSCNLIKSRSIKDSALVNPGKASQYTNDWHKLADVNCFIESNKDSRGPSAPDLRSTCPTSDWLRAAFESTDIVMRNSNRLITPTLIVRANPDIAVDTDAQTEFCAAAKTKCVDIGNENGIQTGHELLLEKEPVRAKFFGEFDAFLKSELK